MDKEIKCELDKWRLLKIYLNCWVQSVVVSNMKSSWRPVTSSVLWDGYWVLHCWIFSLKTRVMGKSGPAENFQMIQNQEEWLMNQRVALASRGIWTGWKIGTTGFSTSSKRRNARSCTQEGLTHMPQDTLELSPLESSFVEKAQRVCMDTKLIFSQQCTLVTKKSPTTSWVSLGSI